MKKSDVGSSKVLRTYNSFSGTFIWKENNMPQFFLEILSNFQLISIILAEQFFWNNIETDGPISRFFKFLYQLLSFKGYFTSETDSGTYDAAALAICIYFLILAVFILWLTVESYRQKKIHFLMRETLIHLAEIHHTVVFWVINAILFAMVNHKDENVNSDAFFQGTGRSIMIGVFMPLNYIVGFWTASNCSNPFMAPRNRFARSSTLHQQSTFWYKAILNFISGLIEDEDYKWAFVFVSLAIVWVRYELLLRNIYYFNFSTFRMVALLGSAGVSFSLGSIVVAIVNDYHEVSWSYLFLSQIGIAILAVILTNSRIYRIIGSCISKPREAKFRRFHEVMRKLMALSYIYENSSPETFLLRNFNSSMVYLFGYVGRHREDCEYQDCFCKQLRGEEIQDNKGVLVDNGLGDCGLIYAQSEVLQRAITNLKDNIGYKILLVSLQYKRKELFAKALVNVYSMHNAKMTQRQVLLTSILIEKLESEVRKFFVKSKDGIMEENVMNMKDLVDFTTTSNYLTKQLEESSEEYIKIWNYYSQPEMVLSELLKQMSAQEKKAEDVEKHWNSLSLNFPGYSLQLYPVYYTYLSLIRNIPVLAEKRILNVYYHKLKVKESNFANKIVDHIENNSKHNVVFYISIAKESFGKVIYASHRIQKFLGWSQAETVGKNISMFQPPFIGRVYPQILQEYVEKETNIIKACQRGFARTREGFLSPIYLYTTLYPYIDVQPMYIVINSPRTLRSEVLILTEEGMIDCFTQGIAKRLNLDPNKFLHIDEICGEWKKLGVTGVRRQSQKTSSDWNKTRTEFSTGSKYLRETDLDFSNEEESPVDDKEISITFWPFSKSERELVYSVKAKRFGSLNKMICLYLDEQGVTREAPNSKVSKLLEEAEESLFNEEIPIETYGVIDQKGMSTENKLTIDGEFELISPAQSSTSPFRTQMTRAENKKLLPKGILQSPRLTTRNTTHMFLQQMQTFQSSHESHRNFRRGDKRQSEKSIINRNAAPSSERASIAGSSRTDTNEKLEKATYCLPKDKLMNLLSYLISAFVIICCLLVCIYVVYESVKLDSIQNTNTMIASMQEQMTTMLNAITPVQLILLVNLGLITDTRFSSAGVASLQLYMITKCDYYLQNYISVSREVIDNMDYLSHDLLSELYDDRFLVNYYHAEDSDAERKVNNFELYSELTNTFTKLVETSVGKYWMNNTDLLFIFNNTMNSPLVASNREVQAILQDSKDNLNYVLSINLMLALLAASIGICLLILLSVDFKKYIRKRNYLIEILLRLDQKKLSSHLALVKGFSERLKAKEYELENEKQLRLASTGFAYKEREVKGYAKQNKKNNKKLNLQTITGLILTMVSIVILVSIFIIFNFLYRVHLNKILTKLDNMVELNQMGIHLSLANVGILDYIINANSTYLENKPIEEVLNRILDDSATIPQFFATISGDDEYQNDIVQTIIETSLCDVSDIVSYPTNTCKSLSGGLLDRGLIQVLNYLVTGYSSTKATYDLYGHTTLAAKLALNTKEKVTGEMIASFIVVAYLKIEHILRIQLDNLIDNHKTVVIDVVIIYAFIYVILGASLYTKVWRNIKYERLGWRRTLRLVPFPIIQTNKLLKLYLINNSDNMLDSIKSALL